MIELLQSFDDRLDDLAAEIQMQAAVNDIRKLGKSGVLDTIPIADQTLRDLLAPSSSARRRLQYSGVVVELYAAWESFVELLVREYVTECAAGGTSLAANVCKRHLAKTMEVISLIQKGVSRYAGEDLAQLLENATRVEKGEYSLINTVALSHHSANLRSTTVRSMLVDIGAEQAWAQALRDTHLLSVLRDSGLPGPHDNALFFLDDLCARRNDIAHGGHIVDTFDETYQLAYLKSLRALGRAFYAALYLHAFHIDSLHYQLIGPFSERYQGRVAIVVAAAAAFLEVGDACVLVGADGSRSARTVTSIQLDSIPQKSVLNVVEGTQLGVQFDDRVAKKAVVYVRRAPRTDSRPGCEAYSAIGNSIQQSAVG